MHEACGKAKIVPAVGFHILRHTHASRLARAGVPMLAIAAQLAADGFAAAPTDHQDAIVASLEAGELPDMDEPHSTVGFDLVWRHLREGLFGDPLHGGNRDFRGWTTLGFPGAQTGYTADDDHVRVERSGHGGRRRRGRQLPCT